MNMKKTWAVTALPLIAMSSMLTAARNDKNSCPPAAPATCNQGECCTQYCLGPDNYGVNAPVRPRTCNGDFVIDIAGFYWNAHQDGMEYAVDSYVTSTSGDDRRSIISATYETPDFNWEFGFKAGIGYNTTCDGWDLGIVWTWYQGKASSHVEAEEDDNHTLLPLWSNQEVNAANSPLFAHDIDTHWKLDLNLVDIDLGREFWVSRRVTLRPHVGIRIAHIKQNFDIEHKGGSWLQTDNTFLPTSGSPVVGNYNNQVDIDNDYKGVGVRAGLDSVWNLGCGWAVTGDMALSILYGRFHVDHDETDRQAASPFTKTKIFETENSFRASRLATDLALGLQWSTLFCDCAYGLTVGLAWEHHLFLDQNQMWRVTKRSEGGSAGGDYQNNFAQSRGDLDTQGWTLSLRFDF